MKKLILGTAQLNNRYGVLGTKKKNKSEIFKFLDFCISKNIIQFDTAEGYKNHKILGEFFKSNRLNLKPIIYTKVNSLTNNSQNDKDKILLFKKKLIKIIKDLSVVPNTVFFHDIKDNKFLSKYFTEIKKITLEFGIQNIGSSIYEIKDMNSINKLKNISLQIPLNPANQQFKIKFKKDIKIIARSIFLQGLLINLELNNLPRILTKPYREYVNYILKKKINPLNFCLNFINLQNINKFIIGADNIEQLEAILEFKKNKIDFKDIKNINNIFSNKESDPRLWRN